MTGPGDIYAKEISGAGNAFAYAIYEHSKRRVLESIVRDIFLHWNKNIVTYYGCHENISI